MSSMRKYLACQSHMDMLSLYVDHDRCFTVLAPISHEARSQQIRQAALGYSM